MGAVMGDQLHHLTLNTGHVGTSSRTDDVSDQVIALLLPMVRAEQGFIMSLPDWHYEAVVPLDRDKQPLKGAAFFQLNFRPTHDPSVALGMRPTIMAMCCWNSALSAEVWEQTRGNYRELKPVLQPLGLWREPPDSMPPLPWLAMWLTPWAAEADRSVMRMMADLERCLVWTLIEAEAAA